MKGDILGYLDVSMDSEGEFGHTVTLVQFAVRYIEKIYKEKFSGQSSLKADVLLKTSPKIRMLSSRERQVIRLMVEGQTESEIATTLEVSCETVKTYRKKIYKKLGVNKKSECLKKARELRLFDE